MKIQNTLVAAALLACFAAHAQMKDSMSMPMKAPASDVAATVLTEGEVRKVDLTRGRVTLKHGSIENLGMPGMTMTFKVADPKALVSLKEGDKVRFRAEKLNGTVEVTRIEEARN
jgi:Cu(I)/Ag(I) efflux system protein CusF